jgi:hypothetical protein
MAAGLISKSTRAARPLFPAQSEGLTALPLTGEEEAKAANHRAQAQRKLKMARVLGEGDFVEETRAALLEGAHSVGRALAIENRLPEPPSLDDALLAPLSLCWKDSLAVLRQFISDTKEPWQPVLESLVKL